jgi:NAD(P)-dependent dehydrogenase (short-subunit alcohol dehydrogenase family)
MNYQGKGVVITGGASGIGFASAAAFLGRGAKILLSDIERGALESARARLLEQHVGGQVEVQVCDVSQREDVERLADEAFRRLGGVHLVFSNAGVGVSGPIVEMRHSDWQWVLAVNLWGAIHCTEAFAPRLVAQEQGGHILFNASFSGLVYSPTLGPYCVSKAGVVALAEVLRQELRTRDIGVSVVCPMRVATNIGASGRNRTAAFGGAAGHPELIDPRDESVPGTIIDSDTAVARILAGIEGNELYILTHADGRPFAKRRFERLDQSFDRQHAG